MWDGEYVKNMSVCICHVIIKIDSMVRSFCLRHYVQNGLSYLGKETWCCVETKPSYDLASKILLRWNKHHLFHRITSIKTPLIYNNVSMMCLCKICLFTNDKYWPSFLWSFPLVALPILMFCFFVTKFSFVFHFVFIRFSFPFILFSSICETFRGPQKMDQIGS